MYDNMDKTNYILGATTVFSPLSCENTSDYQQMESSRYFLLSSSRSITWSLPNFLFSQTFTCFSRRRDRSSSKLREERSPSDQGSPKSAFENAHKNIREMAHFRTKSDITPTATNNTKPSKTFSLSRSKSIASARDKWKISSSYGLLPFLSRDSSKSNLNESGERSSQENMNREIEGLQAKFKSESQERQRLERKIEKIVKLYDQSQVWNMILSCSKIAPEPFFFEGWSVRTPGPAEAHAGGIEWVAESDVQQPRKEVRGQDGGVR